MPYAHWYVDGGSPWTAPLGDKTTQVIYPALASLNAQILERMKFCIEAGTGPEVLQQKLAALSQQAPTDQSAEDPRVQHFVISLLSEGSGTQVFSTSFVQWTTREILRRAQPDTVLARFAPRQREKPFNMLVSEAGKSTDLDPEGSLVDADMAAFYAYLELMRLPDSGRASFFVWFENRSLAFVAGPGISAGTISDSPASVPTLLKLISGPV